MQIVFGSEEENRTLFSRRGGLLILSLSISLSLRRKRHGTFDDKEGETRKKEESKCEADVGPEA